MRRSFLILLAVVLSAMSVTACGGRPDENGLRDSFAQQLAANQFIKDFARSGDEMTFSGGGAEGGTARWGVHIDSVAVEDNADPDKPFKGTVKSSWYSDGQLVTPRGRDSNLPIELMANGLSQDCWALWNKTTEGWEWE